MSDAKHGTITWFDLSVPNATAIRDFYAAVVGWTAEPLSMGDYDDYVMKSPAGDGVAGVCHARGPNASIPPVWLLYVNVADVDASVVKAVELGGAAIDGPRNAGGGRFAVIRDPAGAILAIFQGPN